VDSELCVRGRGNKWKILQLTKHNEFETPPESETRTLLDRLRNTPIMKFPKRSSIDVDRFKVSLSMTNPPSTFITLIGINPESIEEPFGEDLL
jgi:hypothetical protein